MHNKTYDKYLTTDETLGVVIGLTFPIWILPVLYLVLMIFMFIFICLYQLKICVNETGRCSCKIICISCKFICKCCKQNKKSATVSPTIADIVVIELDKDTVNNLNEIPNALIISDYDNNTNEYI